MSTSRPFGYNPSPNPSIDGTTQVGDLAVGTPTSGFTASPQFWNGPDEELGYVIAHPTPSGFQPNPLAIPAYLGFWRTPDLTDGSFIGLAEYVSVQNSTPQTFSSATDASTWLTTNGYWNSYGLGFTLNSSDFVYYNYGTYITPESTVGFVTTNSNVGPGESFYGPTLSLNQGGNLNKLNEIRAYYTNNGLTPGTPYMFNVTWGSGSTLNSGVAVVEFYYYDDNNTYLYFGVVDTSNPIWQTPYTGYYQNPIKTLVGTFNLPVTFNVIKPLIPEYNDWC